MTNNYTQIKEAFNEWAKTHPKPNDPILRVGSKDLSPLELSQEIETETSFGKTMLSIANKEIEENRITMEQFLRGFSNKTPKI